MKPNESAAEKTDRAIREALANWTPATAVDRITDRLDQERRDREAREYQPGGIRDALALIVRGRTGHELVGQYQIVDRILERHLDDPDSPDSWGQILREVLLASPTFTETGVGAGVSPGQEPTQ